MAEDFMTCRGLTIRTLSAAAIVLCTGCEQSSPGTSAGQTQPTSMTDGAGPPWFEEVAAARGISFELVSGHAEKFLMPEIMCGGAALFDMDNDGDLDAYLVQGGSLTDSIQPAPRNQLFRNEGDGTFTDVSNGSGADDPGYGMGVACGDIDNDGDVDLYITNVGPNVLLRNDGHGAFTDVTDAAHVGHPGWGASAAFFDSNKDGWLDLIVTNYLNWSIATELDCYNNMGGPDYCSPQNYNAPAMDTLYRNNGDGTFTDITEPSGLGTRFGTGLGVACGDFDGNGWLDIFIANDGMEDRLWLNQAGSFKDQASSYQCAFDQEGKAKAGMGVTVADIDDDLDLDLLVCNLNGESDSFFLNKSGRYFEDKTVIAGLGSVSRPLTRFGMGWIDFDNDTWLDLYQANGRVMLQSVRYADDLYAEPNVLKRGVPNAIRFEEVKPRGGTKVLLSATSRAAAFGDVDNDGGIDILIVNRDGPAHLLRNIAPKRGHWIGFRVLNEHGGDALNATISLQVGDRTVHRDVRAAYSYLASNDPRVHFGLGDQSRVDAITVQWPDGAKEQFGPFSGGDYHVIRRGSGAGVQ